YGGGGFDRGKMPVLYTPDGEPIDYGLGDPRELRDRNDVVGWRVVCVDEGSARIHWRGPLWTRTTRPDAEDFAARRGYSEDGESDFSAALEDAVFADWDTAHVTPIDAVYPVWQAAEELGVAQSALTEAVRKARADGASWADIGTAAGMTRQSAHERWAKLID
ncbi:hypothetical protein, partial [Nocardia brasiliensis]